MRICPMDIKFLCMAPHIQEIAGTTSSANNWALLGTAPLIFQSDCQHRVATVFARKGNIIAEWICFDFIPIAIHDLKVSDLHDATAL